MGRHLWLVGMMGSGKSSVGRLVAERVGIEFADSDDVVTSRIGRPIADYWTELGEEAFRDQEEAALSWLAHEPGRIVATGGGAVLRESNVAVMRESGVVIWLQAEVATLADRVGQSNRRPLLRDEDPVAQLQALLDQRGDAYRRAAHGTIATDGLSLDTVAKRIEELWNAY